MPNTPSDAPEAVPAPPQNERRRNLALRALIDEMLFQVRGMQREHGAWTAAEREQAEEELARIMARVRAAAAPNRGGTGQTP